MPRIIPLRLAAVCALVLSLTFVFTALAVAKGPLAELRVVGSGGKVLAEKPVPTTRRSAFRPLAAATAVKANVSDRASAQTAASRNGVILGIYATLSSRVELAKVGDRSPGFRDQGGRAFPGTRCRPQWLTREAPANSSTRSQWRDHAGLAPDFP